MNKFLQQMPLSLKIFTGFSVAGTFVFTVAVFHGIAAGRGAGSHRRIADSAQVRETAYTSRSATRDGGQADVLAQWKARQQQLQSAMQLCTVQMNQVDAQMRQAAISGSGMMPAPPACQQQMGYWIEQEALAETEIHRLETGDTSSDVYAVTGIQRPTEVSGGGSSASGGSSDGGDDGNDFDHQVIRETGYYRGEDGEQYELPNSGYHYKDRSSGVIITTNSPDAPNDGRDYEPLQPVERPQ